MNQSANVYKRNRFPAAIIHYAAFIDADRRPHGNSPDSQTRNARRALPPPHRSPDPRVSLSRWSAISIRRRWSLSRGLKVIVEPSSNTAHQRARRLNGIATELIPNCAPNV